MSTVAAILDAGNLSVCAAFIAAGRCATDMWARWLVTTARYPRSHSRGATSTWQSQSVKEHLSGQGLVCFGAHARSACRPATIDDANAIAHFVEDKSLITSYMFLREFMHVCVDIIIAASVCMCVCNQKHAREVRRRNHNMRALLQLHLVMMIRLRPNAFGLKATCRIYAWVQTRTTISHAWICRRMQMRTAACIRTRMNTHMDT